jgi:FkbM family methyltransferase
VEGKSHEFGSGLTMPGFKEILRSLFRRAGLEVRKLKNVNIEEKLRNVNIEETVISNIVRLVKPVAVLDVGANVGQFATKVRKLGYAGTIVSFEALPDAHAALLKASEGDARWLAAPCAALGASQGHVDINIAENSVSSSLLPMCAAHIEAAPESMFIGRLSTRLERLDALAATLIPNCGPLLLKVDTQGYEKEVIKGSTGLLDRIGAIQVEMSLTPLYEGAPSFVELTSFIEGLGYEIFSIIPGFSNLQSGRLLQVDGFFMRKDWQE